MSADRQSRTTTNRLICFDCGEFALEKVTFCSLCHTRFHQSCANCSKTGVKGIYQCCENNNNTVNTITKNSKKRKAKTAVSKSDKKPCHLSSDNQNMSFNQTNTSHLTPTSNDNNGALLLNSGSPTADQNINKQGLNTNDNSSATTMALSMSDVEFRAHMINFTNSTTKTLNNLSTGFAALSTALAANTGAINEVKLLAESNKGEIEA